MSPEKSVPSSTEINIWKSPVPYLFGGLALIVTLISVALIILLCSQRKRFSSSDEDSEEAKQAMPENNYVPDTEPKIVVVMAGDDTPSYFAKPTNSSSICSHCGAEVQTFSLSSTIVEQRLDVLA